ncbi:MAG: ammonium transporter [Candidatus Margulisiibacteriota bacterium]|jgi:Amt family ammonium transporter
MINTTDTAFVLSSAALVMLMTPGLAFFYGGLVRRKNVLSILMQCLTILCVITLQWVLFGYSLAFAPFNGLIGGLQWLGLNGVGFEPNADYAGTIPHQVFMIYQAMFAIITPGLIIGAFAERMKFSAFLLFTLLWATFIYDPVAHWVWGVGGWLRVMGSLDFAGGSVVHISSGISALVTALYLGKRKNVEKGISPHNLPFSILGAGLLWFGWFGFNAGSALAVNNIAVNAFIVTHIAGALGGIAYMFMEWVNNKKPTALGTITGMVAGLATITPAAGYVNIFASVCIGLSAGIVSYYMITIIKTKFAYDDSLDVFGVHGMCGILGMLMTGIFASKAVNSAGANGLLAGNGSFLLIQIIAILAITVFSLIGTYVILKIVDALIGVRVSPAEENMGLDLTQNQESAYTILV